MHLQPDLFISVSVFWFKCVELTVTLRRFNPASRTNFMHSVGPFMPLVVSFSYFIAWWTERLQKQWLVHLFPTLKVKCVISAAKIMTVFKGVSWTFPLSAIDQVWKSGLSYPSVHSVCLSVCLYISIYLSVCLSKKCIDLSANISQAIDNPHLFSSLTPLVWAFREVFMLWLWTEQRLKALWASARLHHWEVED